MSSRLPDINPVIDAVAGRSLPAAANVASLAMIAAGVLGMLYGFFVAGPAWTWGAILVALFYVMSIAQGGVMFSVILTGTWGRWGRPLKRVAETFGFFLPVAWLFLIVFLLFGMNIYSWNPNTIIPGGPVDLQPHTAEAFVSKPVWLTPGFFAARQILGVLILLVLDVVYLRASLRPDLIHAKARLGDRAPAWWDRIIGSSDTVEAAVTRGQRTQSVLMPILGISYAFIFSMLAFDLLMSLSPWWFSNMFGGFVFVSSVWLASATLGLVAMVGRDWLKLGPFVRQNVMHDLGKLLLAMCMFWAYTAYSQLLPIWYTDMPEETDFLLVRLFLPQWQWLAKLVAITCFLAPFTILLSRGIKKMRWPFAGLCGLIMVGLFFERTLIVMPSIYLGDSFPWLDFFLVNIPIWLGFLGLMIQVSGRVLASVPALPTTDPFLEPHPWDVHVHSLDAHPQHH